MYILKISIIEQTLVLEKKNYPQEIKRYAINTAKNGVGEVENSECTPRGVHTIADKIGANSEVNTLFVGRVPTGEIYQSGMIKTNPSRDYILTRIIRLSGTQEGVNKGINSQGKKVDTFERYIYIHGSPDDACFDIPGSRGCIRMRNQDIIELYNLVSIGDIVIISETENFANDRLFA